MKIAVIGAGISGLASAYFLSQKHEVTLFEKRKRLGGHSATKTIDYDNTYLRVDTGFIVYNDLNYPNLVQLFKHLDVPTEASNMSFSFSASQNNKAGIFEWAGHSLNSVFAQRKNIFSLKFWDMLREILRFNKLVRKMEIGKPLITTSRYKTGWCLIDFQRIFNLLICCPWRRQYGQHQRMK